MMIGMVTLGSVLVPLVIIGFAASFLQIRKKNRREASMRTDILAQPILYRSPFPMKVRLPYGWSTKTLGGMELIVTESGVGMRIRFLGLSDVLGSQWWARTAQLRVRIERIVRLPLSSGADWVVLSSSNPENRFEVAILAGPDELRLLAALRDTGVRIDGNGPSSP